MKIQYHLEEIPLLQQSKCIGDLIRYYGESKYSLKDKIDQIKGSSYLSEKLLTQIKKHTGNTGLTIDKFSYGLSQASNIDIFSFKVNNFDISTIFKDKNMDLEITVNPLKFTTEASLKVGFKSFRKKDNRILEKMIAKQIEMEKKKYIAWFERELNGYHTKQLWNKTIINE